MDPENEEEHSYSGAKICLACPPQGASQARLRSEEVGIDHIPTLGISGQPAFARPAYGIEPLPMG